MEEDRNFFIQDIGTFLSHQSLWTSAFTGFQYCRLEKTKRLKLDLPQTWAAPGIYNVRSYGPNYVSIQNEGEDPAYYFIVNITQKAKETIALDLELDVLNTFPQFLNMMSDKTRIVREHRDRFFPVAGAEEGEAVLFPIFSRTDEGEKPPLVRTDDLEEIDDVKGGPAGINFYLIYRTANGVPCLDLCASEQLLISKTGGGQPYTLNISDMVAGRYYYMLGQMQIYIQGQTRHYYQSNPLAWGNADYPLEGSGMFVFYKNSDGRIAISFVSDGDNLVSLSGDWIIQPSAVLPQYDKDEWQSTRGILINEGNALYFSSNLTYDQDEIKTFQKIEINAGGTDVFLSPISVLDRTESTIVKVIECPYCPIGYTYDEDIDVRGLWTFEASKFPSRSPEGFLRTFDISNLSLINEGIAKVSLSDLVQEIDAVASPKGTLKDPKLYISDFYQLTLIYDSFASVVRLEDLQPLSDATYSFDCDLSLNFCQSTGIASSLIFDYDLESDCLEWGERSQNFPEVLAANRNNELPLFSSDYLNYLRNGYNYDKKKIAESVGQSATLAGIQLLGSILSFALSGVTGGASALAGVGLLSGAIQTGVKEAVGYENAARDLEQKINLLKSQGFNVSGVDDLSLFKRYGKNKLLTCVYSLRPEDEARLADRFHYFGYASNRRGKISRSRLYFDFVQCDAVFENHNTTSSQGPNIWEMGEYVDFIREKLAAGVTFFWKNGLSLMNWQLLQNRENIEVSIYNVISL